LVALKCIGVGLAVSLFCCRRAFGTEGRAAILAIVIDVIAELLSSEEIEFA
jgi:hypothetical protein